MGRRITALAHEHPEIQVSGALESPGNPAVGADVGEVAGIGPIGVTITDDVKQVLANCDVLVEFSAPGASVEHVKAAAEVARAAVVGTTGFNEDQKKELRDAGTKTRLLVAPNMSMGVNLLFNLAGRAASLLGDSYDVEIVESHHKLKKDAPSGTAIKLAEIIASALGRNLAEDGIYGRQGQIGERKPKEIGVLAIRGGDIVGEHTVMFITGGERIELTHKAHSRDALAAGALKAALWLVSQPNGMYDMQDVLGLKGV